MTVTAANAIEPREPKYYLVKRHLLELIESLEPGALVPTERELTATLVTSRTTVRQALGELVGEARLLSSERMRATGEAATRLRLLPGAYMYRIERLRLADDTPMAVETSHLSVARFPGLIKALRKSSSLYRVLDATYGVVPLTAEETIETRAAPPREAALLGTDTGAPMLVLGRHSFEADGTPIEWVRSWYRGDRYTFVARLTTTG